MSIDPKRDFYHEIDIVQNIIGRMAQNSFMIKGWTITLVAIALLINGNPIHTVVAFLPWLVFWCLDAYYLRLERCYRELYNWLITNRPENQELLFDMDAEGRFGEQVEGVIPLMISQTLAPFYLMVLGLIAIISWYSTSITS